MRSFFLFRRRNGPQHQGMRYLQRRGMRLEVIQKSMVCICEAMTTFSIPRSSTRWSEGEKDSYWECPYPGMHDASMQPSDLTVGQLSDDFDFVKLVRRGQNADVSYNLVHIAPLLRYIGETVKS
jgi:hypothetical protein